jgi:hypothetical protein
MAALMATFSVAMLAPNDRNSGKWVFNEIQCGYRSRSAHITSGEQIVEQQWSFIVCVQKYNVPSEGTVLQCHHMIRYQDTRRAVRPNHAVTTA